MSKQQKIVMGAPEWMVTFADLMSLLVCFFVLLISFSVQDQEKVQVVAGSMRDAFGIQPIPRKAGMIERDGTPVRKYVRSVELVNSEDDSEYARERHEQRRQQGPEANTHSQIQADIERRRDFALAAASLRQAWAEMPDINELSDNIMIEETPDGLNVQLIDQEGRSMFSPGAAQPNSHTRELLARMAPVLAKMPNRIQITGHTDSTRIYSRDGYSQWELSADRANAARRVLSEHGLADDRFYAVTGRADTEPLFPDDTFLAANRRVTILIMAEDPPLPPDFAP